MNRPVFLVGMPGAGKSTVGRRLSGILNRPFIDLDEYLEEREGRQIRDIFAGSGEKYFREAEAAALRDLAKLPEAGIVATGGGAPCYHGNMAFMNETGTTVFLKVPTDILVERLSGHARELRPLVAGKNIAEINQFVTETLAARIQFYDTAHISYSSLNRDVSELSQFILKLEALC